MKTILPIVSIVFFACSCSNSKLESTTEQQTTTISDSTVVALKIKGNVRKNVRVMRLSHAVNTSQSEYNPCPMPNGDLAFSAMDRSGFFDYRIDFTKHEMQVGKIYLFHLFAKVFSRMLDH